MIGSSQTASGVDLGPATTYEVLTRQKVDDLAEDVHEIKQRLDGLFWMVAGAVVLEFTLQLAGFAS